jgi:predicted dehydrogenase
LEEGQALIKKQAETGCEVQIGQVIRFWDEYVALKEIIESGKYGRVVNANFRRISPRPTWGWDGWLLDEKRSGGAGQDLHIHDVDYVLSVFGEPEKFYSVKNSIGEAKSYVNTLMQYKDFAVSVEGTWDMPGSYPFSATFRVVFEKAVVENAGGKFMLYDDNGATEIKIDKKELVGEEYKGGNISDLGAYYNELVYFCDKANKGEKIEKATLADGVSSLEFLIKELNF